MRRHLVLAALLLPLAACGSGARGPVVSPTGIVYEPGVPPQDTRFSQTAILYLHQGRTDRALDLALEGVASDSTNPIHFFLAGSAYSRLRQYESADRMFDAAQRLYPAYELDVEPEREGAWGEEFNLGIEQYGEGDLQGTLEAWRNAVTIYDLRPEAHRNLGTVLAAEGMYEEAVETYRRGLDGLALRPATRLLSELEIQEREEARRGMERDLAQILLFSDRFAEAEPLLRAQLAQEPGNVRLQSDLARALEGQGRFEEASDMYDDLLYAEELPSGQMFNLGVAFFRSGAYAKAAEAFARLSEAQPNSRDAWFNYANSLLAGEAWGPLATVGRRLVELDPLSENAALIAARADLENGDQQAALRGVQRADGLPIFLSDLQMNPSPQRTTVAGTVTGNRAVAGTSLPIRFTFYGEEAETLGTVEVTLEAPATGDTAPLELEFERPAAAYRYELAR